MDEPPGDGASTAIGTAMELASAVSNLREILQIVDLLDDVSDICLLFFQLTSNNFAYVGTSSGEGDMEHSQLCLPAHSCAG